jgi:hypothetical protein
MVNQIKTKWTVKNRREPLHYKRFVWVVYWREMNRVKTTFILLLLLVGGAGIVFAQPETCQPSNCSVGTLEQGGSYTGLDGITIKASKYLDKTLTVYIERIEDTSDLIPLSFAEDTPLKAETPYYRIGATENYRLRSNGSFSVRLPLPTGVAAKGLAVFSLAIVDADTSLPPVPPPADTGIVPENKDYSYWSSYPVNYMLETNQISFPTGGLSIKGELFTIVSGRYSQ